MQWTLKGLLGQQSVHLRKYLSKVSTIRRQWLATFRGEPLSSLGATRNQEVPAFEPAFRIIEGFLQKFLWPLEKPYLRGYKALTDCGCAARLKPRPSSTSYHANDKLGQGKLQFLVGSDRLETFSRKQKLHVGPCVRRLLRKIFLSEPRQSGSGWNCRNDQ